MILQVAADVAPIRHVAHARDAPTHGVAPAKRGRNCAGNATDHGMNSTIVVSFSRGAEVPEAMADVSDHIEKLIPCTTTEHAPTQELHSTATEHAVRYASTQSQHLRHRCATHELHSTATSTEVVWQQRKCRRLLRYLTLEAAM